LALVGFGMSAVACGLLTFVSSADALALRLRDKVDADGSAKWLVANHMTEFTSLSDFIDRRCIKRQAARR
jgi:hypothetical protein